VTDEVPAADPTPPRPLLRIVRGGEPSDDELAAVVAVLAARASGGDAAEAEPLRKPLPAWVASGLVKGTRTKV
jgi:Acyl-CoA carboxylase epsilon subunit